MKKSYISSEPDLNDAFDVKKKEFMLAMNCHAIATVQEFDSAKQTVKATINYKKSFMRVGADGKYGSVLVDYPILVDVPIIVISGGKGALTMPIAQGDECMILFNDRDIDNWFAGGGVVKLNTGRLHSFSDGIALIGLNSLANVITNYDAARVVLRNGTASVGVSETLIQIKNENKNLKTILTNLITAIKGISTAGSHDTLSPANMTALDAVATDIAGLLE